MDKKNISQNEQTSNIVITQASQTHKDLPKSSSGGKGFLGPLLGIVGVIAVGLLVATIVLGVEYHKEKEDNDDLKELLEKYTKGINDNSTDPNNEKKSLTDEEIANIYYISDNTTTNMEYVITPKNGYNYIILFLCGISEVPNAHLQLFKDVAGSKTTQQFKIVFMSGTLRVMKFMVDKYNISIPVPGWFNTDTQGLIQDNITDNDNNEIVKSQKRIISRIEELVTEVDNDYKKIFLGGFSQGAIMTTNVLLNMEHELGGYMIFSGYILSPNVFPAYYQSTPYDQLSEEQKNFLNKRKDYNIYVSHSFNDPTVPYELSITSFEHYFRDYTKLQMQSFGEIGHNLEQSHIDLAFSWIVKSLS